MGVGPGGALIGLGACELLADDGGPEMLDLTQMPEQVGGRPLVAGWNRPVGIGVGEHLKKSARLGFGVVEKIKRHNPTLAGGVWSGRHWPVLECIVGRRGNPAAVCCEHGTDWLDPEPVPICVDESDDHGSRGSSSLVVDATDYDNNA